MKKKVNRVFLETTIFDLVDILQKNYCTYEAEIFMTCSVHV